MEIEEPNLSDDTIVYLSKKYENQIKYLEYSFSKFESLQKPEQKNFLESFRNLIETLGIPFTILFNNQPYLSLLYQSEKDHPDEIISLVLSMIEVFSFEKLDNTSIPNIISYAIDFDIGFSQRKPQNDFEQLYSAISSQISSLKQPEQQMNQDKSVLQNENFIKDVRNKIEKLRSLLNQDLQNVNPSFKPYHYGFLKKIALDVTQKINFWNSMPGIKHKEISQQLTKIIQKAPQLQVVTKEMDPRWRTSFIEGEFLQFDESQNIEYKNYFWPFDDELVHNLKKQFCGFLNSIGGRLYIGVKDNKQVIGLKLSHKEQDIIKLALINYTKEFYPECRDTGLINVYFLPIMTKDSSQWKENFWIIKVIIKQGDPTRLYSISERDFKSFIRLDGLCIKLDTKSIEFHISDRIKNQDSSKKKKIDHSEFNDLSPVRPSFINKIEENQIDINQKQNQNQKKKNDKFQKLLEESIKISEDHVGVSVWGLPPQMNEEFLQNMFSEFSLFPKKPVAINRNEHTRLCNGSGFINFLDYKDGMNMIIIVL